MLKCFCLSLLVLAVKAMKRSAEDICEPEGLSKRQNIGEPLMTEKTGDNLFQNLPCELLLHHLMPEFSPGAALLFSLTSKENYEQLNQLAVEACFADNLQFVEDYIQAAGTNTSGFTGLLSSLKLINDYDVLTILLRDHKLDLSLTYAMMMDSGRTPSNAWISSFWGLDMVQNFLAGYSGANKTFALSITKDSMASDIVIFYSLQINMNDNVLFDVIRHCKTHCSMGLFFLLVKFNRSEDLVKRVLELDESVAWRMVYPQNIPQNVIIPASLIPIVSARIAGSLSKRDK